MQVDEYAKERSEMEGVSREEYLAALRRRSSGFSRGVSKYRGVARYYTITALISSSVLVSQKTMVYYSKTCKIHDEMTLMEVWGKIQNQCFTTFLERRICFYPNFHECDTITNIYMLVKHT